MGGIRAAIALSPHVAWEADGHGQARRGTLLSSGCWSCVGGAGADLDQWPGRPSGSGQPCRMCRCEDPAV
eukprot:9971086-Alexandrium_andersonii.AAC.1